MAAQARGLPEDLIPARWLRVVQPPRVQTLARRADHPPALIRRRWLRATAVVVQAELQARVSQVDRPEEPRDLVPAPEQEQHPAEQVLPPDSEDRVDMVAAVQLPKPSHPKASDRRPTGPSSKAKIEKRCGISMPTDSQTIKQLGAFYRVFNGFLD